MSAKQFEKRTAGTMIIYLLDNEPIAIYDSAANQMISPRGKYEQDWCGLPNLVWDVITKLGGRSIGIPRNDFLLKANKLLSGEKHLVLPDGDLVDRETLILGIVEMADGESGAMLTVAEIREALDANKVPEADGRWVHDMVYRLYKAGKLRSEKIGGRRIYGHVR